MHSRQAKLLAYAENLAEKTAAKSKSGAPVLFKYTDPETGKDFYLTEKKMTGVRSPYSGKALQGVKPEKDTLSDVGKEMKEDAKAQKAKSKKAALLAILQGTTKVAADLSPADVSKLKKLRDMVEHIIDGEVWTKLKDDEEFKVSPYGLKGDYDKGCRWVSFDEVF